MKRILVTGADGFIGRALCLTLRNRGESVRCALRQTPSAIPEGLEYVAVGDIGPNTEWADALHDVEIIVHLAGHTRVIGDAAKDKLSIFRRVNVGGTELLAKTATKAGVRRFIYISSVKVNGEGGPAAYTEMDAPAPQDPYGISKWEAERVLCKISRDTGLEIVIIRPPLVYGPGVKANFLNLIRLAGMRIPLPFGGVYNRRSLLYLGNLVDAICISLKHPRARNETFLVSDGRDVSLPDLIRMISFELGRKPALFSIPPAFLKILGKALGRREEIDRLAASLFVDSSKIRKKLDWDPPFTVEEGIRRTIRSYKLMPGITGWGTNGASRD